MMRILRVGLTGLSLLSLLAFVSSCTRDTAQSDNAAENTTTNAETSAGTTTDADDAIDNRPLSLTAHLVEEEMHAKERAAVVQVEVTGIRLVDAETGMEGGGAYGTSTSGTSTSPVETGTDNTAAGTTPTDNAAGGTTYGGTTPGTTPGAAPDADTDADGMDTDATTTADGSMATARMGHIHYRLDGGPVIATPVTRLAFHELAPGQHTVTVMLAAPDHTPLGPQQTLTFTIPAS
jgi:hypothetical protein